jgi:ABC-2 type transport system ATP-binding protein
MVAKALIHRPSLLILDEPTAGVDVELRIALWDFIREIRAQGTTVLLTTHYLDEAEKMCDRVAIMDEGRIVALERTADLIAQLGERKLTLHFGAPLSKLPSSLSRFAVTLGADGARAVVALAHGQKPGDLLEAIHREGIRIENLEESKPGLEEVFLKLTRKRPDERVK